MLQRKEDGSPTPPARTAWYMVVIDYEEGTVTPEELSRKLADSVSFVEGVGYTEVVYQGDIANEKE